MCLACCACSCIKGLCSCGAKIACCGKQTAFLYCLPLAVGALTFSCIWVFNGAYQVTVGALQEDANGNPDENWLMITAGSIDLFIGFCGLCATFIRMSCGAMLLFYCYCFSFLVRLIAFIIQWVDWGTGLDDGSLEFESNMAVWTTVQVIFMGFTWWVCDIFYSMASMLDKGKNPWQVEKDDDDAQASEQNAGEVEIVEDGGGD